MPPVLVVTPAEDLVHAGWFFDLATEDGLEEFVNGFTHGQVGVAIQSTERFSLEERREMVRRIMARGAAAGGRDGDRASGHRAG